MQNQNPTIPHGPKEPVPGQNPDPQAPKIPTITTPNDTPQPGTSPNQPVSKI